MEITWYGHSCFRLTERNMATVICDPFDSKIVGYEPIKLKGDIVTSSHDAPGHNYFEGVKGFTHAITGPGEFEIGGVFITGIQIIGIGKKSENKPRNTLYVFDFMGITVAHLGDLGCVPTQTEIEALGTVNVALVPAGGGEGLNAAKAAEIISMLEPNIAIPMHYQTPAAKVELDRLEKFLKEMGSHDAEHLQSLKVNKSNLPEETRVIVLEYQRE